MWAESLSSFMSQHDVLKTKLTSAPFSGGITSHSPYRLLYKLWLHLKQRTAEHMKCETLLEPDWRCSFSVVRWSCYLLWSYDTTKKKKKKLSIYQFSQLRSPLWWECTGPCPGPSASGRPRLPKRSCKSTNPKASTLHLHTANCCSRIFSDILWVRAVRGRSHTLHAYVPGCMASTLITSTWDHWLGSGHLGHAQTCSELQLYLAGLSSGFGSDKT